MATAQNPLFLKRATLEVSSDSEEDREWEGVHSDLEDNEEEENEVDGNVASSVGKKKRKLYAWVLVANNLTREQADLHPEMQQHVSKHGVRDGGAGSKVVECSLHASCKHMVRMRLMKNSLNGYELHRCGVHGSVVAPTSVKNKGLPKFVLQHLDPILMAGHKPKSAEVELRKILETSETGRTMLASLVSPSEKKTYKELLTKIANRKKTLTDSKASEQTPYVLNSLLMERELDLNASADDVTLQLSTLGGTFGTDGLICCARLPLPVESPLLVPYQSTSASATNLPSGTTASTPVASNENLGSTLSLSGYVLTSQRWLQNLCNAIRDVPDGLRLSADGTYKLVWSNWTLILATTHTINLPTSSIGAGSEITHTAVPLFGALVQSESETVYRVLFGAVRLAAQKLYLPSPCKVLSVAMDHCQAIKNAVEYIFGPQAAIIDCWPHLLRNARKRAKGMIAYFDEVIEPMLQKIHCAPSLTVVYDLSMAGIREWKQAGFTEFSEWFYSVYLDGGWSGWWCGASRAPGAGPTNNPLEAMNKDIKQLMSNRVSMTKFDCKNYFVSSYLCSHVLVAAHHEGCIDLAAVRTSLDGPRKAGRPPNRGKALNKDDGLPTATVEQNLSQCNLRGGTMLGVGALSGYGPGLVGPFHATSKEFTVSFAFATIGPTTIRVAEELVREGILAQRSWEKQQKLLLDTRGDDASL